MNESPAHEPNRSTNYAKRQKQKPEKSKKTKRVWMNLKFVLRRWHHHSFAVSPSPCLWPHRLPNCTDAMCNMQISIVAVLRIPINNRKLKNVFSMLIKCWTRVKGSKMFALVYSFLIKHWLCVRARTQSHTHIHRGVFDYAPIDFAIIKRFTWKWSSWEVAVEVSVKVVQYVLLLPSGIFVIPTVWQLEEAID